MLEFRENAGAEDRDAAFVRACAVKMHMDISEEPFYAGLYRKNARAQDRDARFAGACAVQMDMTWAYHKSDFMREFTHVLQEPSQSKCTSCEDLADILPLHTDHTRTCGDPQKFLSKRSLQGPCQKILWRPWPDPL